MLTTPSNESMNNELDVIGNIVFFINGFFNPRNTVRDCANKSSRETDNSHRVGFSLRHFSNNWNQPTLRERELVSNVEMGVHAYTCKTCI